MRWGCMAYGWHVWANPLIRSKFGWSWIFSNSTITRQPVHNNWSWNSELWKEFHWYRRVLLLKKGCIRPTVKLAFTIGPCTSSVNCCYTKLGWRHCLLWNGKAAYPSPSTGFQALGRLHSVVHHTCEFEAAKHCMACWECKVPIGCHDHDDNHMDLYRDASLVGFVWLRILIINDDWNLTHGNGVTIQ